MYSNVAVYALCNHKNKTKRKGEENELSGLIMFVAIANEHMISNYIFQLDYAQTATRKLNVEYLAVVGFCFCYFHSNKLTVHADIEAYMIWLLAMPFDSVRHCSYGTILIFFRIRISKKSTRAVLLLGVFNVLHITWRYHAAGYFDAFFVDFSFCDFRWVFLSKINLLRCIRKRLCQYFYYIRKEID